MSNAPGVNPYDSPKSVDPKPGVGDGKVRYMYAYSYVFENPNWMTNIMYGCLCMFIPVVGPLLLLGYQFEIVESLHRYPGRMYPNFDFSKFTYFLVRGLWPFLVSMICALPMVLVIYALLGVFFVILGLIASAVGKDAGGIVFGLGMILFIFIEISLIVLVNVFVQPFMLRAGLSQDFGQAFKFGWVMDFIKRNWLELVLFQLFFFVTSLPLALIGMAFCFIGIYPAAVLIFLAQSSGLFQLYNLHLLRGGEPIPLKTPPPESSLATV